MTSDQRNEGRADFQRNRRIGRDVQRSERNPVQRSRVTELDLWLNDSVHNRERPSLERGLALGKGHRSGGIGTNNRSFQSTLASLKVILQLKFVCFLPP